MKKDKDYPVFDPGERPRRGRGDYIDLPDGGRIAPNGAVIEEPMSEIPEIAPPYGFTPEQEDLDLLIM